MSEAYITLATNDQYAIGAMTLASSLRCVNTTKKIVVMVTSEVSSTLREVMKKIFDEVIVVNVLDSFDSINLELLKRSELGVTFTKLHCWKLGQFSKGVFMDADTLVLKNIDELFERKELSAAPDIGWPDIFNSGVFVFHPNEETYRRLLIFASKNRSFDGADQGLLNLFFSNWATRGLEYHLPFIYNCASESFYSYNPAFNYFKKSVKVIHFIGNLKPWHYSFHDQTAQQSARNNDDDNIDFIKIWWDIFMQKVFPLINPHLTTAHDKYLSESFDHIMKM